MSEWVLVLLRDLLTGTVLKHGVHIPLQHFKAVRCSSYSLNIGVPPFLSTPNAFSLYPLNRKEIYNAPHFTLKSCSFHRSKWAIVLVLYCTATILLCTALTSLFSEAGFTLLTGCQLRGMNYTAVACHYHPLEIRIQLHLSPLHYRLVSNKMLLHGCCLNLLKFLESFLS